MSEEHRNVPGARDPGEPRFAAAIILAWRQEIADRELVGLTKAHGGRSQTGWWDRIRPHSLGWVSARNSADELVGFVNVAWDGGVHAFLLDPTVHPRHQRSGLGTALVTRATQEVKELGCEWLHVDFEDGQGLADFYFEACGFRPTSAGLIRLPDWEGRP